MNQDLERLKALPARLNNFEIEIAELRRHMNNRFMALLQKITAMHLEIAAGHDREIAAITQRTP